MAQKESQQEDETLRQVLRAAGRQQKLAFGSVRNRTRTRPGKLWKVGRASCCRVCLQRRRLQLETV